MIHGVNHIALSVADMKRTLEFYTGLLGLRLVGLFPMHGVEGATHAFLDMGDGRLLSFIAFADAPARIVDVTGPKNPAHPSAIGTMHHVALNVPDEATLHAVKARVEAAGLHVGGPIDHGFCHSIYFAGPDREQVEVAAFSRALDEREIDGATVAELGIAPDLLARMRRGAA
jgi:catechol 2,3-dioxygenase-like lactoylglutathione lyase family enzyme